MTAEAASTLDEAKTVRNEFREAVNMTVAELEKWLATPESREVGWKEEGQGESVGHASGRRIVELLGKRARDLSRDDLAHMRKVVGYVHRHLAQRPQAVEKSRWRYSLMNWGHDPMRR
ncbi:DUF3140 domain-containing protein [Ramlibacter tataouinensis]|uniref:DNA-binding protein n=1 Tax=Ramlibacter tataouinensis (strain ATCC BAA-407 / DSM 14655 / LMG 21543 / TTB310) TaxID=365046 RepID=F5Y614_RAMTT|nr:DUF3140 domain-containing protein [Ramlibacter tataouinensis]AEG91518.1 Conserved hypothetical protein [Ramlibacter tataouinensis TTB310]